MIDTLPLAGKNIFIPRGGNQGNALCERVVELGGKPYSVPLIDFREGNDQHAQEYINRFNQYEWIIFTSQNGVTFFFKQLEKINKVISSQSRISAVGEKTKERLDKLGLNVAFVPKNYTADDFAKEFLDMGFHPQRVLIPKGNLAKDIIANSLESIHCIVDEWIVYETFFPIESRRKLEHLLTDIQFDYAMFTSPSTVHHFMEVVRGLRMEDKIKKIKTISIGPVTNKTIESYGWSVSASPDKYTVEDMLGCLCSLNAMEEEL
jgi:uroporphyrinogen-III synthase